MFYSLSGGIITPSIKAIYRPSGEAYITLRFCTLAPIKQDQGSVETLKLPGLGKVL
jgi:hypothetical protein